MQDFGNHLPENTKSINMEIILKELYMESLLPGELSDMKNSSIILEK